MQLILLFAVFLPVRVSMAALDKFEPYAYARVLYDSNLFRTDGDIRKEEDDTITHLGGGLKSDLKLSRQHLLLDLKVDRALYKNFDELDHTRVDGTGAWAWQVGNLWSGTLGYKYQRKMSSFNEQFVREKDMRTTQTGFFGAGYQIHPDWKLKIGADIRDVSYQDRKRLDRDATSGLFEVQYRNTRNTRVGVRVKYTDNDLKDQDVAGVKVSNDYTETEVSGVLYWEGTAKSSFEARLGYTEQSFDELSDRDYKGSTGRLTYFWKFSSKTNVNFSVWRETSTKFDEVTTYVLTKGAKISPTWKATPKITVFGNVSYVSDDFKGQNDVVTSVGGPRRDDDIWKARLGARWQPRQFVQLSLSVSREDRDSSIDVRDFTDDQVDAKLRFNF